jgi:hypothetical protein
MSEWHYRYLEHGRNNMVMTSPPFETCEAVIRAARKAAEYHVIVSIISPDGTETPWEQIDAGGVEG